MKSYPIEYITKLLYILKKFIWNKISIHYDNLLLVKDKDAEANTLKNEPEKLLINQNAFQKRHKEQIIASSGAALEHSAHQSHQEYKKLSSEDLEHKQIISIGQTDLYEEKMKIRIPDPTFDDNFHNEKSHNSVRVNSIHHKVKEEEGFEQYDQNGQHHSFEEKYKEVEDEELKNKSRTERDLLIGSNVNNDHEDLLVMDEENPQDKINEDNQDSAKEGEGPNGEHTTPENGEANQEENNSDNNNGEDNAAQDNGNVENGENGEANVDENKENNDNMEPENVQEEQTNDANNGNNDNLDEELANGKSADTPRENAVADEQDDENINQEADNPPENAEGDALQAQENNEDEAEKVEGEVNCEAVEPKVEAESQQENHENQQVENAENKEESPQE